MIRKKVHNLTAPCIDLPNGELSNMLNSKQQSSPLNNDGESIIGKRERVNSITEAKNGGDMLEEKAERKRQKKERQKQKKLTKKIKKLAKESTEAFQQLELVPGQGKLSTHSSEITLCNCPLKTIEYFFREIPCMLGDAKTRVFSSILASLHVDPSQVWISRCLEIFTSFLVSTTIVISVCFWNVSQDEKFVQIKQLISWYGYWIFLGILSSVGLGTGLHTFILYLGPFIANVTLAAQECSSVDFLQPPYPDQIVCRSTLQGKHDTISVWAILAKVRYESFAWGIGTALGELPPYFMARAAKLAHKKSSPEFRNPNEIVELRNPAHLITRCKLWMKTFVEKLGFWGILVCASIPNPLFDLAGITCGHFLIPFMTFFGATMIGKAVIKSQLQLTFVVLAFDEQLLTSVLGLIGCIPKVGHSLENVFSEFMDHQRAKFSGKSSGGEWSTTQFILEKLVICMVLYFVGSIINGMAQRYHKRCPKLSPKLEKKVSMKSKTTPEDEHMKWRRKRRKE